MTIRLHRGDLPDLTRYSGAVAIDTETMGLEPVRDRLCVVQLSPGDGTADVVQMPRGGRSAEPEAPARRYLQAQDLPFRALRSRDPLQGARRDAAAGLLHQDRLAPDPHLHRQAWPEGPDQGLARQGRLQAAAVSDWGAETLTEAQVAYAADDVLNLHALKDRLDVMLAREGRTELADACFQFLPDPRPARSRRLGRGRHLRAFMSGRQEKWIPVFPSSAAQEGKLRRKA